MPPNIPGTFNANRLKVQLRLAVNRLKLLQQKKQSLGAAQRREIATLMEKGKAESARVRVEHIVREDMIAEALEVIELFAELLLARFGMIEASGAVCEGVIQEAVHTLIYAAPRTECKELGPVRDLLAARFGRDLVQSAMDNRADAVNRRVIQKLKAQTPEPKLVSQYLKEIAKAYSVEWEDDVEEMDRRGLGSSKDVRMDPSGSYAMYDASETGFTPSRDYTSNPLKPTAPSLSSDSVPPPKRSPSQQPADLPHAARMSGETYVPGMTPGAPPPGPMLHGGPMFQGGPMLTSLNSMTPPPSLSQPYIDPITGVMMMPTPAPPPGGAGAPPGAPMYLPQTGGYDANGYPVPSQPPSSSYVSFQSVHPVEGSPPIPHRAESLAGEKARIEFPGVPESKPPQPDQSGDANASSQDEPQEQEPRPQVPDYDELVQRFEALKKRK